MSNVLLMSIIACAWLLEMRKLPVLFALVEEVASRRAPSPTNLLVVTSRPAQRRPFLPHLASRNSCLTVVRGRRQRDQDVADKVLDGILHG